MDNKPIAVMTTPKGTAVFPQIVKPTKKFDKDGVYEIKLRLDKKEDKAFIAAIERHYETNYQSQCEVKGVQELKRADYPFKDVTDKDTGKPTGEVEFKFKMKASGVNQEGDKWEQRPKIFDPAGNPIAPSDAPMIGSGTTCKVNFHISGWNTNIGCGISLKLRAVQIIKLVEYSGGGDAASFGFSNEGEAFEQPERMEETTVESTSSTGGDF